MRKVHEKSIILGIGIGMVITSIVGLIYTGGAEKGSQANNLSREEIIRLAKSYGMVETVPLIDDNPGESTQTNTSSTASSTKRPADTTTGKKNGTPAQNTKINQTADDTGKQAVKPAPSNPGSNERNIVVEIKDGFDSNKVAQLLYEKGIISNKKEFVDSLASYNATTKINIGKYNFKTNDDYVYIIKTICNI